MKGVKFGFLVILLFFAREVFSQETIKVMHYNLLYYGKLTDWCTTTNNNIDAKNQYLKTIIQHVKPDIFSVNEMDGEASYPVSDDAQYLLDHALNADGVDYYRKTAFPEAYLANAIFYNSNKLVLKESHPISFYVSGNIKVFNAYKFYFNADDLEVTQDTAFLYCVVAHLKAGNSDTDRLQRNFESGLIMDYFESIGEQGSYLLMGDFNVYTPTEDCFQNFINPDNSLYTFYDPANQLGEWSANYDYRFHHTQSTHSNGECHSGGGMDDRFDFILASDYVMSGTGHYRYIPDSYKAVGQDGSGYNQSLNTTSNTVVPNTVAQALYNMSDHLPVYMELEVDQNLGEPLSVIDIELNQTKGFIQNPVYNNLSISVQSNIQDDVELKIHSLDGKLQFEKSVGLNKGQNNYDFSVEQLISGLYIVSMHSKGKIIFSEKMIKK